MKGIKGITPYNQRLYAFVVNLKTFAFDVDVIPFIPFISVISGFGMVPLLNSSFFHTTSDPSRTFSTVKNRIDENIVTINTIVDSKRKSF